MIAAIVMAMQVAAPVAQAAPATPDAAALALGQRLAETGTLASLLPMMEAKETAELVAAHPGLTAAEQAALRQAAAASFAKGKAQVTAAMGRAYAQALTREDLTAMIAFNTSPLARRYRATEPQAIAAAMQGMATFDFKADAWTSYCAAPGRHCSTK